EALSLDNLSRLDRGLCRWASAEEAAREALEIFELEGHRIYTTLARRSLGIVEWKRGRIEGALKSAEKCIAEATHVGSGTHQWYSCLLKGMILLNRGENEGERKCFTA